MSIENEIFKEDCSYSSNKLDEFMNEHYESLANPVIKAFLKEDRHFRLFASAICFPTPENKKRLDTVFKMFFSEIRFLKYISKIIHYYSIDFDRVRRKYEDLYPLILDEPVNSDDNKTTFKDFIITEDYENEEKLTGDHSHLEDHIENKILFKAYKKLTTRQKEILQLAYIKDLTDTEIGKQLSISQQAVSKIHKKALSNLFKSMARG